MSKKQEKRAFDDLGPLEQYAAQLQVSLDSEISIPNEEERPSFTRECQIRLEPALLLGLLMWHYARVKDEQTFCEFWLGLCRRGFWNRLQVT